MQNDSYNRGGYIAFVFSIVFSLAFFVYVAVIHPGINLKEVPEVAAPVDQTLAANAPSADDVTGIKKPWEPNEAMVAHGKVVFGNTCAVCHGAGGAGDGPAGAGLKPPPRNFVEPKKWTNGGDSIAIFKTLQEGIAGTSMASFASLPPQDRWALVQFVRSLNKTPVKDDLAKVETFAQTAK